MAKGWCEECDSLVGISPTGEVISKRPGQRHWKLDVHPGRGPIQFVCPASGEKV